MRSGNAMLVGVGGSGKQSLARLAAHICGFEVFQIAVTSTYGVADFKEALLGLYTKAGAKGQPVVFLITDNQIVREHFLVFINDLLSTGIVADLFSPEDRDTFCSAVRNEVKATGTLDTQDACWDFFINKVHIWLVACAFHSCSELLSGQPSNWETRDYVESYHPCMRRTPSCW